jgi:hypothetical protein
MIFDVREGNVAVAGDDGIGLGTNCPLMSLYIGEGAASIAETTGIGNLTPGYRFEVRRDGTVGVK